MILRWPHDHVERGAGRGQYRVLRPFTGGVGSRQPPLPVNFHHLAVARDGCRRCEQPCIMRVAQGLKPLQLQPACNAPRCVNESAHIGNAPPTMRAHAPSIRDLSKAAAGPPARVLPKTVAPVKQHAARFSDTVLNVVLHDHSNVLTRNTGKTAILPQNPNGLINQRRTRGLASLSPYRVASTMLSQPHPPKTPRAVGASRSLRPLRIMPRLPSQRRPKTSAAVMCANGGSSSSTSNPNAEAELKFAKIEARGWTIDSTPLGEGSFGTVHLCNAVSTGKKRVCKAVRLPTCQDREDFRREVRVLKACGKHKNICGIVDAAEDTRFGYLVLQPCMGGELFERIKSRNLDEREAAMACADVLSALSFLHSKRIVHRDVKPENLMYQDLQPGSPLLLIDFGFATQLHHGQRLSQVCGTAAFMAPEVLRADYALECDMWSLGVMAHLMLSGKLPFPGRTDDEKEARILRHTMLSFADARTWATASEEAKEFIQKLLNPDACMRMSCRAALQHPWITSRGATNAHQCSSPWMPRMQASPRRLSPRKLAPINTMPRAVEVL